MTDPRWEALIDPDRPEADVLCDGTEVQRDGGIVWVVGRHIREAVLGIMLFAGRPMSAGQILAAMEARRVRIGGVAEPRKAVSDVLRYQLRLRRVRRVAYGVYGIRSLPRTTAWRVSNRLRFRSWPWAVWEVADSRPSMDVPLPPGGAAGPEREDMSLAHMSLDDLAAEALRKWDMRRGADPGPVRSDGWPSAS